MRRALLSTCALATSLSAATSPGDWPRFRGPNGAGVAPDDAALPARLDPETNLVWETALPPGHSSPCIAGRRVFLTAHEGEELLTLCLDRATGKELWRRALVPSRAERLHDVNDAAAPTPTAGDGRVVVSFGAFGLLCYDEDGEELWRLPLPPARNSFGTAASPVLAGGRLVLLRDTNETSFVETLDPASGEVLWRREREGFASGWSTPVVRRAGEVDELVVYGVWWLSAYDLADGAERWSVPGLSDEPIVTPVLAGDLVFVTSYNMKTNTEVLGLPTFAALLEELDGDGDGRIDRREAEANQSVLSRSDAEGEGDHPLRIFFHFLDTDEDGAITSAEWPKLVAWLDAFEHANALVAVRPGTPDAEARIAWQFPRGVPECPSPLAYDGRIYLVKNGGMVTCLDAATGELRYQGRLGARGPWYSSPVAGDGKVYAASAKGVVTVFAAGDELAVLSAHDFGERIMATPALAGGRVYVRTAGGISVFGAR